MDVAEGCRHLREYKEEEGLDAYKTVHAWFATPVSAAARRFVSFVFNLNLYTLNGERQKKIVSGLIFCCRHAYDIKYIAYLFMKM